MPGRAFTLQDVEVLRGAKDLVAVHGAQQRAQARSKVNRCASAGGRSHEMTHGGDSSPVSCVCRSMLYLKLRSTCRSKSARLQTARLSANLKSVHCGQPLRRLALGA